MKIKLKTITISIIGVALVAIIGGETFYIINSRKNMKNLTSESTQLKSSLKQVSSSLKEKEDQINKIQEVINGKSTENTVKEDVEKEQNKQDNYKKQRTIQEVVGKYENKVKFSNSSNDNTLFCELDLAEDGTYKYEQSIYAEAGEFGNWHIDENGDIVLNRLFTHSSDAGLRLDNNKEVKKLIINEDGTLMDTNKKFKGGEIDDLSKVKLNKKSGKTDFNLHNTLLRYREISKREGYDFLVVMGG